MALWRTFECTLSDMGDSYMQTIDTWRTFLESLAVSAAAVAGWHSFFSRC